MNNKDNIKIYIFPSLLAGITVGVITSIILSIVLFYFYGENFKELSFLNLSIYMIGKIGSFSIVFSFVFSVLIFSFQKLSNKFIKIRKKFPFFLSSIFSIYLCLCLGFYINSNLLRFSREMKSYLVDLSVLFLGLLLFFIVYKIIPSINLNLNKKREFKFTIFIILISILLFSAFSFKKNPFSKNLYISNEDIQLNKNYDSKGNFLGSLKNVSPEKLNIILISIDTLRADGLSCYGNSPFNKSKH